jgi:sodium-coupled neutral amino acid transporter 11
VYTPPSLLLLFFGQVLDNFPRTDDAINVARFFYAVTIMLTYPIECFVAREVIAHNVLHTTDLKEGQHNFITVAICVVVMVIALATTNLGLVLEFNGVVNATLVAFVLPGLCGLASGAAKWRDPEKRGPLALTIFGFVVVTLGLVLILVELASGAQDACPMLKPGEANHSTNGSNSTNDTGQR